MTGPRGFFAVGVVHPKTAQNIGTLLRSANLYGAAYVFTVGRRYRRQASDTAKTHLHIPLMHYADVDDLVEHLPRGCPLVGVELDPRAVPLTSYQHLPQAAYLLGAEDHGLTAADRDRCHELIQVETAAPWSMNVAVAGSIVMHDRHITGTVGRRAAARRQMAAVL